MRGDCVARRPTQSGFCGSICGDGRCAAPSFAVSIRLERISLIFARLSDGLSLSSTGRSISRDREKMKCVPRFSNRKVIGCFDSGIARCLRVWRRFLARSTSFFVVRKQRATERKPDSRAAEARCIGTLTFILALTRELCVTSAQFRTERNLESRAKHARCIRTLTFILSLTGRGDSQGRRKEQSPSLSGFLFPLPVRERMKVRVLMQRAFFSARIKILSFWRQLTRFKSPSAPL
jgi:hypothetical protein